MRIKGIVDEDFVNYKETAMYLCTAYCDFKCDKEAGVKVCQNSEVADMPFIDIPDSKIIERYLKNPITHAFVFGGLEPFKQFDELLDFVKTLRRGYRCFDPVIIYTGYNEDEIAGEIAALSVWKNIIVKFGRYIPGHKTHFDELLGVALASDNQYAKRI